MTMYDLNNLVHVMRSWNHDPLLAFALDYVRNNNPSHNLPYHNTRHMEIVAALATVFYQGSTVCPDLLALRMLVLAALFHDFDHSGGQYTDDVNIDRAVEGWKRFSRQYKLAHYDEAVIVLIRSTQYPMVKEPESLVEKALHDADYIYGVIQPTTDVILVDLKKEMEVRYGRPISLTEMYLGQTKFMTVVTFYTLPGNDMWASLSNSFHRRLKARVEELSSS